MHCVAQFSTSTRILTAARGGILLQLPDNNLAVKLISSDATMKLSHHAERFKTSSSLRLVATRLYEAMRASYSVSRTVRGCLLSIHPLCYLRHLYALQPSHW